MLALVDRGIDRETAYVMVQRHALAAWEGGDDFHARLKGDDAITAALAATPLDDLFDYDFFIRHATTIIDRALAP